MKNKMLWIGSVIILILSVICFVVFGVGTELIRAISGEGNGISFGKYNKKDIVLAPGTDFANAVQYYTNFYQNQGMELNNSTYFYIYNNAFNAAVQSAAYKDAVEKSGYKPSGKSVSRVMLPYFLNAEGKYDPKIYNQVSNADKESLKNNIAKQLVWQRFSDDTFGSSEKLGDYTFYGIKSSEKETAFLASINQEKRSFDTVSFDKSSYPESEVKKFASENISLFDTYSLSMITVKEESQAKKLQAQIANNEVTFEDAIKEYSEKYYTDGDGKVKESFAYQVKENLASADDFAKVDSLAKDGVSEVIQTNKGYSIYKCTGDKAPANLEESKTLDAVRNYITANKSEMINGYFTEKAKSFIASAKLNGFDKAAKDAGVEVVSLPAFPLNYGSVSIADKIDSSKAKAFSGADSNEDFLKAAFSMKEGDISEPTTMGNYISVFTLTGIQNDAVDSEKLAKISEEAAGYDQSSAQSTLLASSKVQNNVTEVYFNKIIAK